MRDPYFIHTVMKYCTDIETDRLFKSDKTAGSNLEYTVSSDKWAKAV
jgi:hypothetical protein